MKARGYLCRLFMAFLLASSGGLAGAQSRKAFDVVSVRPEDPRASTRPSSRVSGDHFEIVGVRAWELVARAFRVSEVLRVAIPEWAKRDRFAIRAVMPIGSTERDIPDMLRTMLEERFGLKAHVEQRPYPVYELIVLPSGPKFREVAAADDLKKPFTDPAGPPLMDFTTGLPGDELRTISARFGPDSPGGVYYITSRTSYVLRAGRGGAREVDAARITMPQFASSLGPSVDRIVVDRTGLTGIYQLKTLLPPPALSPRMQELLKDRIDTAPSGISISRVLNELGLKLEPKDELADFVVVDSINSPTAD